MTVYQLFTWPYIVKNNTDIELLNFAKIVPGAIEKITDLDQTQISLWSAL